MFRENAFQNIKSERDRGKEILSQFSSEQQAEIESKRKILSSLAYFIGKDFQIPVELNEPGAGWHWDFKNNVIRIDPKDLLEREMDYLRFVISHEGGHRRISRTEFIPSETWRRPGFSFMMNAVEDPRDNNFVAESLPKFKEQMELAYREDLQVESKHKQKAKEKLGYTPRFMQAGFEFIKQWFREASGKKIKISDDLPDEVETAVKKTLASAKESWLTYPSKEMADGREYEKVGDKNITGEELIKEYARASYLINLEKIWPEFEKLVEKDLEDQKMQELIQEMSAAGEGAQDEQASARPDLKDKLTPEEQQELEEAIKQALEAAQAQKSESAKKDAGKKETDAEGKGKGAPLDLDSLSDELKQKIKEYIDGLPEDKKQVLADKARNSIKDFEKELSDDLEGKLTESPDDRDEQPGRESESDQEEKGSASKRATVKEESDELKKYRAELEKSLQTDATIYEAKRREVLDVINKLENDLREIFVQRRTGEWKSGFKSGKRIDIKKRVQEKAKGITAMESKAWQRRELPSEKDYAITLLVDLSGSMRGEKINETFKAVIILAEVLNKLSINVEILGFNDRLYKYQQFGENMSGEIRENIGGMPKEVENFEGGRAEYNDDGWAVSQASARLDKQKASEKFLLVLSDGVPEESPQHSDYDLQEQIDNILKNTRQKLIGLGIGRGTSHVNNFYPNSLANIEVREMGQKLAQMIKEAIENFDKF